MSKEPIFPKVSSNSNERIVRKLVNCLDHVRILFPQFVLVVGGGAAGHAFGLESLLGKIIWLSISLIAVTVWYFLTRQRQKDTAAARREADRLQLRQRVLGASLRALLESSLRGLLRELRVDQQSTRASIYQHDDGKFRLLSRVSGSRRLERKSRPTYSDKRGFIGLVWDTKQWRAATDLPEDEGAWVAHCIDKHGLFLEEAKNISMKARSMIGTVIETPGSSTSHVGILIVESMTPRGVNAKTIEQLPTSAVWQFVAGVLQEVVHCVDSKDVQAIN